MHPAGTHSGGWRLTREKRLDNPISGDPWLTIDERGGEFLTRPLTGDRPCLWLNATYLKVRQGGRIVPVAAMIAVAAHTRAVVRLSRAASLVMV